MIEINDLFKHFGSVKAVDGVSLTIQRSEVVVIIGSSGSGKSTLLRCVNRLIDPTTGVIIIDGVDVTSSNVDLNMIRAEVGMVFQQFNLFPHYRVIDNIRKPLIVIKKFSMEKATNIAKEMLVKIGLEDKINNYPAELSGGQQQRVAIGRALAMNPKIMLFDEPTSALDPELTGEVLALMKKLADEGMTMLVVSHEMGFAREAADRIIHMDEGKIVNQGSPTKIFEDPENERTQQFLKSIISH
ncbi:MAG: amino acid ABC transporter ATP-binding protein [Candidatus Hodarchaeales archaeon]